MAGGCTAVVLAFAWHHFKQPSDASPPASVVETTRHDKAADASATHLAASLATPPRDAFDAYEESLAAILAETDAAKRHARLRDWADSVQRGEMLAMLERIQNLDASPLRAEALQALLHSWTSRDLVAVTRWFGALGPAFDTRQEARDQLVLALLQCDPESVIPALQGALPASTSRELYGPYFRGWAATEPAIAAAKLRQLAEADPEQRPLWNDLITQVAAQWVVADPERALAWVHALPEGPARTAAQIQTSYHWTEINPAAASAYAAKENDANLAKTVAAKWAEASPAAALAWAQGLPDTYTQSYAITGAASAWAQQDPLAAAAYAAGLKPSAVAAEIAGAVVSAWAFSDPDAAGQWATGLPAGPTRDHAVESFCVALHSTAPDQAFQLAATIAEESLRNTGLQRAGFAWLQTDPSKARGAIAQATIPDLVKQQLLGEAAP